jgi:hypothetical protein
VAVGVVGMLAQADTDIERRRNIRNIVGFFMCLSLDMVDLIHA